MEAAALDATTLKTALEKETEVFSPFLSFYSELVVKSSNL